MHTVTALPQDDAAFGRRRTWRHILRRQGGGHTERRALDFVARDEKGNTAEVTGTLNGDTITGKVVEVDASDPVDKAENTMTATRRPERSQLGNAVRLSSPSVL